MIRSKQKKIETRDTCWVRNHEAPSINPVLPTCLTFFTLIAFRIKGIILCCPKPEDKVRYIYYTKGNEVIEMVSRMLLEKSFTKVKDDEINLLVTFFGNQNKLAIVLGVDRTRITRWQRGINPDEINGEKISGLVYLLRLLFNHYNPETAMKWLQGNNVFVGNSRPIDLIRTNKITEVIVAARQDIAGTYA